MTSIGKYAFAGCSSLTRLDIPNSVTEIGEHAFDGCSSLTGLTIPETVRKIGRHAFDGCISLCKHEETCHARNHIACEPFALTAPSQGGARAIAHRKRVHCLHQLCDRCGLRPCRPRAWSAELLVGPYYNLEGVSGIFVEETYGGQCLKGMKSQRGTGILPALRGFAPHAAGMNAP